MKRLGPVLALALLALVTLIFRGRVAHVQATQEPAAASTTAAVTTAAATTPTPAPPAPRAEPTAAGASEAELLVRDVTVRDQDGRVAWRGDVDLRPVLSRIARGERDPHRTDGEVFGNRERRLPQQPRGWYREYVVRTPGLHGPGPQRLVVGRDGAVFYTFDHYATFTEVRGAHGPDGR